MTECLALPSAPRKLECCAPGTPGPAPVARSSTSTSSSSSVSSPSSSGGTAREARGVCVSSRTAQAEEPSEQGEGEDDEDKARFVCLFRVCSDFASKAARRDVEEQAAPATADPVEGAKQDVPPSVLLLRCFARFPSPAAGSCCSPTTARRCHQRTANSTRYTTVRANTVGRGRASQRQRGSGEVGRKGQQGQGRARQGRREGRQGQAGGRQGQGGGQSKRPGRTRAGRGFRVCSCCSAPAWSSCVFVRSNRFCFLGSCSPLSKDSARR